MSWSAPAISAKCSGLYDSNRGQQRRLSSPRLLATACATPCPAGRQRKSEPKMVHAYACRSWRRTTRPPDPADQRHRKAGPWRRCAFAGEARMSSASQSTTLPAKHAGRAGAHSWPSARRLMKSRRRSCLRWSVFRPCPTLTGKTDGLESGRASRKQVR